MGMPVRFAAAGPQRQSRSGLTGRLVSVGSVAMRFIGTTCVTVAAAASILTAAAQKQSLPAAGLRIVIVEGEDAVNIVQQKTAVAPVVEVRDRNDQPVAGAVVNFA